MKSRSGSICNHFNLKLLTLKITLELRPKAIQWSPLVRSAFCPKVVDLTCGLTLHLSYNSVLSFKDEGFLSFKG